MMLQNKSMIHFIGHDYEHAYHICRMQYQIRSLKTQISALSSKFIPKEVNKRSEASLPILKWAVMSFTAVLFRGTLLGIITSKISSSSFVITYLEVRWQQIFNDEADDDNRDYRRSVFIRIEWNERLIPNNWTTVHVRNLVENEERFDNSKGRFFAGNHQKLIERIRRTAYVIFINSMSSIVSELKCCLSEMSVCEWVFFRCWKLYIVLSREAGTCKPIITLSISNYPKQYTFYLLTQLNDRPGMYGNNPYLRWKPYVVKLYLQSCEANFLRFFLFLQVKSIILLIQLKLESQIRDWSWKKNCTLRDNKRSYSMSQEPDFTDNGVLNWKFRTETSIEKYSNIIRYQQTVSTLDDKVCDEWIKCLRVRIHVFFSIFAHFVCAL